tara:strand:+ start:617 stop:1144 length:528 start_codon:yes stop_codon:yes gene_type:complete
MEKRIKSKIDEHQLCFKKDIQIWINDNNVFTNKDIESEFLKYIFDYSNIVITEKDLQKRKRSKNIVPEYDRCNACRANGEQCTRRKKLNELYCGTHVKGTPNGIISSNNNTNNSEGKKITIRYEDIVGIQYYIDENNNVYSPEDILSGVDKPKVIGTWKKKENGEYCIPNLGINL